MRGLFFLTAAITAPTIAAVAQAPATSIHSPVGSAQKAVELLNITMPIAQMQQQMLHNFLLSFDGKIDNDPKILAMDTRKPGLVKALKSSAMSELNRRMPVEISELRATVGVIYQQVLTDDEMGQAISFFRSPAGTRMLAKVNAGAQQRIDELRTAGELRQMLDPGLIKYWMVQQQPAFRI